MAEQELNRNEPATPFKLEEARKEGKVAKSLDVNSAVLIWTLTLLLLTVGVAKWQGLLESCRRLFVASNSAVLSPQVEWWKEFIPAVIPVAAVAAGCAVLANIAQTGVIFSAKPLAPKFERINPIAGFKRVFNRRMVFEVIKALLKFLIIGAVAWLYLEAALSKLRESAMTNVGSAGSQIGEMAVGLLVRLSLAMLIIALLDLLYVRWRFGKQMMMSRRELKEEVKRREGDPLVKAKLRELQRENLKQSRSVSRVAEADVLITNPEHLAIALRYDRQQMRAPEILAKGADRWAQEMKRLARQHGVSTFERRSLARLLFARGTVGRAIPVECFVEVARIYADIEAARRRLAHYEVRT